MPKLERLWSDDELFALDRTIDTLRRMRGAATDGLEVPKPSILSRLFRREEPPIPKDRQTVLADAERLASSSTRFLARRIAKDIKNQRLKREWLRTLEETEPVYRQYPSVTFARTKRVEVGGSIIGHMRAMSIDPDYVLNFTMLQANNLGVSSVEELSKRNIILIAPLSGDLLMACFNQTYLQNTRKVEFAVRAAAGSENLTYFVLPNLDQNLQNEVGIFLDVIDTGKTGKVLAEVLTETYPNFLIHPPKTKRVEFEPSEKMKKFMDN